MPRPSRRRLLRAGAAGAGILATLPLASDDHTWHAALPLLSQTVALRAPGQRLAVHAPAGVLPGTRILRGARHLDALAADEQVVRDAVAAHPDPHGDLLLSAALDLHVLSAGLAAPIASWARSWRYVWPRDAAHVAVAFARLGLADRAAGIVRDLARLAGEDGWFEARYVVGTRRSPDGRGRQLDGTGWFLWALDEVAAVAPALPQEPPVRDAARRCARMLLGLTGDGDRLPPASPDFWEVRERRPTIGSCAMVAAGLERAGTVLAPDTLGSRCARASGRLRARIAEAFGRSGYGRYPGRRAADAGMLFLLPPYARAVDPRVAARVEPARAAMARAAGGVAPGELWRRDGVSWTPQSAMFAQARSVIGDAAGAAALLGWLAAHRTSAGSLPEKVLVGGEPASVAPLAWTAALVVTTAAG